MSLPKMTLKAARVNCGLTQKKAAECLGITPKTLGSYETGASFPDVAMVKRIEDLYGVPYRDLIFLNTDYD